jgi:hypothetical protein
MHDAWSSTYNTVIISGCKEREVHDRLDSQDAVNCLSGSEVAKGNGHNLIRRKGSEFCYRIMNDAKYHD